MKKRLLQALARLASVEYQDAYILRATQDVYVLPEDIVEDVSSLCGLANRPQYQSKFTAEQLSLLDGMVETVKRHGAPLFAGSSGLDADTLIRESKDWALLRQAASECLVAFGINVESLPPEKIDQGGDTFWT